MNISLNFRAFFAVAALALLLLLSGCKAPNWIGDQKEIPPSEQPTNASTDGESDSINVDEVFEEEAITPPQIPG